MTTAVLDAEGEAKKPWNAENLTKYLRAIGGRDVLEFDDANQTIEAARDIRALAIPGLEIDTHVTTIRLKLREKKT